MPLPLVVVYEDDENMLSPGQLLVTATAVADLQIVALERYLSPSTIFVMVAFAFADWLWGDEG